MILSFVCLFISWFISVVIYCIALGYKEYFGKMKEWVMSDGEEYLGSDSGWKKGGR